MKQKILQFFHLSQKKSARNAKERLQIVVSHQRATDTNSDFLPELRKELLNVICKYITIDIDQINVNLQKVGNCSILELNVTIPEELNPVQKNAEIVSTKEIKEAEELAELDL